VECGGCASLGHIPAHAGRCRGSSLQPGHHRNSASNAHGARARVHGYRKVWLAQAAHNCNARAGAKPGRSHHTQWLLFCHVFRACAGNTCSMAETTRSRYHLWLATGSRYHVSLATRSRLLFCHVFSACASKQCRMVGTTRSWYHLSPATRREGEHLCFCWSQSRSDSHCSPILKSESMFVSCHVPSALRAAASTSILVSCPASAVSQYCESSENTLAATWHVPWS